MPVCGSPIRDLDHIHEHRHGGATSGANGQGLCRGCHTTRHSSGWLIDIDLPPPRGRPDLTWITPTGHRYRSRPPPALGPGSVNRRQPPYASPSKHNSDADSTKPPEVAAQRGWIAGTDDGRTSVGDHVPGTANPRPAGHQRPSDPDVVAAGRRAYGSFTRGRVPQRWPRDVRSAQSNHGDLGLRRKSERHASSASGGRRPIVLRPT
jgi:HNH endonuclease